MSSKASTIHGKSSTKSLIALCTYRVAQNHLSDFAEGFRLELAIVFKSILFHLGVLKKQCIFSTNPIQFLIDWSLYDDDTAKFNECAAQWTYMTLGYSFLIFVCTPLTFPAILAVPSYPWPHILVQPISQEFKPDNNLKKKNT